MNQLINSAFINRFITFLIMAAVIKTVMLIAALFLPDQGIDTIPSEESSFYAKYKPSALFALTAAKSEVVKNVPVYKLDKLLLKGIFADKAHPFIMVEENKEVTLISKGEKFKGYKLIEIHAQKAIFEKNGRHYELAFKEAKNQNIVYNEVIPEFEEGKAVFVKRKEIKHYAKNFDEIWKNIKIKELVKNKRLEGFKVTWVKKDSIFAKMGLIKDDIITGVNGKRFKSLSQVFKLYNNMDKLDSIVLKIKRGNEERELEYEIY